MWKISGYIRRLPLGTKQIEQQESAAYDDRGIRNVKSRPLKTADVEQKEIGDPAVQHPVEDVPRSAAQNQREAPKREAIETLGVPQHDAHQRDRGQRRQHEQGGTPLGSGIVEDAEGDTAIFGMDDIEKSWNDFVGIEKRNAGFDDHLGRAIEHEYRE